MHWWSLNVITSRTYQSPILEARRGAAIVRSIIDLPRSSSERKIPALIQHNQVIPGDHLTDQDSPPVHTGFSLLRIVGGEVAAVHTYPRHLHPNEPRVGLQEIPDAQIWATVKDPSPP